MRRNRITLRVRWADLDPAAIAYYPHFFRWFDIAAQELFRSWKASYAEMFRREGRGLSLVEAHCRFFTPVTMDDDLEIETVVAEVRTRAFRLEHTIWRRGERVAAGHEVRMWVHHTPDAIDQLSVSPLPADVVAWMHGEDVTGGAEPPSTAG